MDFNAPGAPPPCGPPPPCIGHSTIEEAAKAPQTHAFENGYSLVFHKKYSSSERAKVYTYKCAKGSHPRKSQARAHPSKRRTTYSQMTGCMFTTRIKLADGLWTVQKAAQTHNHGFTHPNAWPSYRRQIRGEATTARIIELHKQGMPVVDILYEIGDKISTKQDIHNLIQRRRRDELMAEHIRNLEGGNQS